MQNRSSTPTRLPEIAEQDREAIRAVPAIYQTEITKWRDLRVTVVGERVFAVAIRVAVKE